MRKGLYGASEATLRMKMDMTSPNPNMWDQVGGLFVFIFFVRSLLCLVFLSAFFYEQKLFVLDAYSYLFPIVSFSVRLSPS